VKIHDGEQGGLQWITARLGKPTASQAKRIMTPKTLKPAAAAKEYLHECVAEWMTGQPTNFDQSAFMERGTALESKARRWYEFEQNVEVQQVGFCADDLDQYGCSPDGLVGSEGGVEIKCLGAVKHVGILIELGDGLLQTEHYPQVQMSLHVTGREWWDLVYYAESMPSVCVRYEPDDIWLGHFTPLLERFCAELREIKEGFIAKGWHGPDTTVSEWLKRALELSIERQGASA